jgi:hypothetical protein
VRYVAGFLSLACLGLAASLLVPACTDEGEGQPCSTLGVNGGDDECQPNLICTTDTLYKGGVCCPSNRALAITIICKEAMGSGSDAMPPADVGPPADAGADGGMTDGPTESGTADAPTDTRSESASEAGSDGMADGTAEASDAPTEGG